METGRTFTLSLGAREVLTKTSGGAYFLGIQAASPSSLGGNTENWVFG